MKDAEYEDPEVIIALLEEQIKEEQSNGNS